MEEIGTVTTFENDTGVNVEWKIEKFFSLTKDDGEFYWSPEFSFDSQIWDMWIIPNGNIESDSSGFIGLHLEREYSRPLRRVDFSMAFKTVNGKKDHEKYTEYPYGYNGHGFARFISRSEFFKKKSELVPSGVLTVMCTILKNNESAGIASNTAISECCYCKLTSDAECISSHQKRCRKRPIKCPDCLDDILLRDWLYDHECQKERKEGVVPEEEAEHKQDAEHKQPEEPGEELVQNIVPQDDESLCQDYKKVLLDGHKHDLILKVRNKELRAHQDILRARSRVFESMLSRNMKEKNSVVINVPDCDPQAMELFLSYVYCGKVEALDDNNMLGLYYISEKYEMMGLKRECRNFIKKLMSLTNICNIIQLAMKYADSDLLEHATEYFIDNVLSIMHTVEWGSFLKNNSSVGNKLLIKAFKKLKESK